MVDKQRRATHSTEGTGGAVDATGHQFSGAIEGGDALFANSVLNRQGVLLHKQGNWTKAYDNSTIQQRVPKDSVEQPISLNFNP
jgi:hypothetical protein